MEVVLLEDVKALGKKGQIVKVNDGYARNFILPKKLGVEANTKNLNDLKLHKANEEKVAQENLDAAKALATELETKQVVVKIKAGEGGRTFGSVSSKEIATACKEQHGIEIDKKKIQLPESLKNFGSYEVTVKLHPQVAAKLTDEVSLVPRPARRRRPHTTAALAATYPLRCFAPQWARFDNRHSTSAPTPTLTAVSGSGASGTSDPPNRQRPPPSQFREISTAKFALACPAPRDP